MPKDLSTLFNLKAMPFTWKVNRPGFRGGHLV